MSTWRGQVTVTHVWKGTWNQLACTSCRPPGSLPSWLDAANACTVLLAICSEILRLACTYILNHRLHRRLSNLIKIPGMRMHHAPLTCIYSHARCCFMKRYSWLSRYYDHTHCIKRALIITASVFTGSFQLCDANLHTSKYIMSAQPGLIQCRFLFLQTNYLYSPVWWLVREKIILVSHNDKGTAIISKLKHQHGAVWWNKHAQTRHTIYVHVMYIHHMHSFDLLVYTTNNMAPSSSHQTGHTACLTPCQDLQSRTTYWLHAAQTSIHKNVPTFSACLDLSGSLHAMMPWESNTKMNAAANAM